VHAVLSCDWAHYSTKFCVLTSRDVICSVLKLLINWQCLEVSFKLLSKMYFLNLHLCSSQNFVLYYFEIMNRGAWTEFWLLCVFAGSFGSESGVDECIERIAESINYAHGRVERVVTGITNTLQIATSVFPVDCRKYCYNVCKFLLSGQLFWDATFTRVPVFFSAVWCTDYSNTL